MKIPILANSYPIFLENSVKEQLLKVFNEKSTKDILKNTSKEYKEILKRSDDIGGKENKLIDIVFISAYIIALYKNCNNKVSTDEFKDLIFEGIKKNEFLKKQIKKVNPFDKENLKELKNISKWSKDNSLLYKTNWILDYKDTKDKGVYMEIKRCTLCILCEKEGVVELKNVLCEIDKFLVEISGFTLKRTSTIADGYEKCDFWVY